MLNHTLSILHIKIWRVKEEKKGTPVIIVVVGYLEIPIYCYRSSFFITFIYILLFINVNHHQSVISSTFEVLKSARNGIVYGGKLRFLHALVINLLYRSGPIVPRLKSVLEATKDHAQVLAAFAII